MPGFFLFSWIAWVFIFLIFLNAKDENKGVFGLLGWGALIGFVYCAISGAFLIQYKFSTYLLVLSGVFPVVALYLGLLYVLIPSGRFSLRGALLAGLSGMIIEWIYGLTQVSGIFFQVPFLGPEPFLRIASVAGLSLIHI